MKNLISTLKTESEIALNWFKDNHMIVDPGKCQAVIFDKRKENHTNQIINIDKKEIKAVSKVKLLGIETDDKLHFNNHINALIKLKHLFRFEERKVLINTFVM